MAHQLDQSAGRVAFAYTGAASAIWHGLGQQIAEEATEREWIEASGLDWRIESASVQYQAEGSHYMRGAPDSVVLYRTDTHAPIGVVSPRFKVVQPSAQFQFFREFCRHIGAKLSTAGALFDGRQLFASAEIGSPIRIAGQDYIRPIVMFHTANDGSFRTTIRNVNTRPVCNNTVSAARGEGELGLIRVSHRSHFDPDQTAQQMASWVKTQQDLAEKFRMLSQIPVQMPTAQGFVFDLFNAQRAPGARQDPLVPVGQNKVDIRNTAGFRKVLGLFDGGGRGAMLPGVRGTAWGLFNAVTEYVDHYAAGKTESHRWQSALLGKGATLKDDALSRLLALAD